MGEGRLEGRVHQPRDKGRGWDGGRVISEYRRWEERVGKSVGEGSIVVG